MFHYCCFCGGPLLENARAQWLKEVEICGDPKDNRQLSFIPPPTATPDIVTISNEDGEFWFNTVCVGRAWSFRGYVSRPSNDYGDVSAPPDVDFDPYLVIHPWCLSFLCRRINATPEQIWNSVYGPGSDYPEHDDSNRLLDYLEYYDLRPFHDAYFQYYPLRIEPKRDGKAGNDVWRDSYAMKELQWILARPTIFPIVPSLVDTSTVSFSASPGSISQAFCMRVFNMGEIFDVILDYVIGQDISQAQLNEELLQSEDVFTAPSITQGTKALFALLQVNKALYAGIVQGRQSLFLRLAWVHGWMLPTTPEDWKNWPNGPFEKTPTRRLTVKDNNNQDWRAYLLIFLRKENVHVRNRWRLQRMAMQFGRGRSEIMNGREYRWRVPVGELGFRPDVEPPEPFVWELTEGDAV